MSDQRNQQNQQGQGGQQQGGGGQKPGQQNDDQQRQQPNQKPGVAPEYEEQQGDQGEGGRVITRGAPDSSSWIALCWRGWRGRSWPVRRFAPWVVSQFEFLSGFIPAKPAFVSLMVSFSLISSQPF
jgi:hypothetical protein